MRRACFLTLAFAITFVLSVSRANAVESADPLPSWNAGPEKTAIIDFVRRVTSPGVEFVPVAQRIAVFDNDGTLWPEQPVPTELLFLLSRIRSMAPQHPDWRHRQPFEAAIAGDLPGVAASGKSGFASLVAAGVTGMSTDEFDASAKRWLATARNPKYGCLYVACVYKPMIEVLGYLRANGFTSYIVSGGTNDFIRAFAQTSYGIPPDRVIGTTLQTKFEAGNGKPQLIRLAKVQFIDDGAGKPEAIQRTIGIRPIAAFGNSDGDREMLEWTAAASPALMVVIHHTDATREYAYDRSSKLAKLDRLLDEANSRGWDVVDMRRDWNAVFPTSTI